MSILGWIINALGILLMFIVFPLACIWALAQWVGLFIKKPGKTARDIAEERYASGEISAAELLEIKRHLS